MSGRRIVLAGAGLVIVGIVLIGAGTVLASRSGSWGSGWLGGMSGGDPQGPGTGYGPGMMGGGSSGGYGPGMMGGGSSGGYGPGMKGGGRAGGYGPGAGQTAPQPGGAGFVAGTPEAPRVIQVIAGPGYTFTPSDIKVQRGETVTFQVTALGPLVHEFMVGPADAVAADREGTPEIADIGMMQTRSLSYTFDGSGPYAFACHAPGHDEAGMKGTITVVG